MQESPTKSGARIRRETEESDERQLKTALEKRAIE
jgi:hypothetical protein